MLPWLPLTLLLALCLGVTACAPITVLNSLVASDGHVLTPSVAYGTLPRQRLDVYRPTAAEPPGG